MNDNELRERLQNLENQVFGMTHENWHQMKSDNQLTPELIKKLHDDIRHFDPKGTMFVYRVRKIQVSYGLSDVQMQSLFGIIKSVYEGRTKDIYSIKPAVVAYPELENSLWDNLITSFDCNRLGYELREIEKRLDALEK